MRKNKVIDQQNEFSILTLDDDKIMTETLQSYFQAAGYRVDIENDPIKAIDRIRTNHYDILLLDFLMRPILGDEVVRKIREFDKDLYIILLTGHKSMAPPIRTIRELDIQGYYEKSDRFDQLELLIESCAKSIRQMRTIRNYRDGLRKILEQVPSLNHYQQLNETLKIILEQITEILPCQDCFIYLELSNLMEEKYLKQYNLESFRGIGKFQSQELLGESYISFYLNQQQKIKVEPQKHLITAPICAKGRPQFGIIQVLLSNKIQDEDIQLLEVYSKQIGEILNNIVLHSMLQLQNTELIDAYASMRKNYMETVDAMRTMVDAKDFYTRGHSDRVSFYAVKIAQAMGKDDNYVERIRVAGLFHDIGKIGIPDGILQKAGPLTNAEYDQIKRHPALGQKILSSVSFFNEILPIIQTHHERIDGNGYPLGLSGKHIPEEARIISIADSFDAMTSKRSYRNNLTLEEAISELVNGKNTQFDATIVDIFLDILNDYEDLTQQLSWTTSEVVEEFVQFEKR